jgi:beta-lactamase superfamily II metal-dependent hydrolase
MNLIKLISFSFISSFIIVLSATAEKVILPKWEAGLFDIHHINTGRGDATYFIFPDGTDMLFDVGDVGRDSLPNHQPLKMVDARPNATKTPGEWVADYIQQVRPKHKTLSIDYAVISHFHSDHYGNAETRTKQSKSGNFIRTGISELGDIIPITTLIDRAYPDYNIPLNLREYYGKNLTNYLNFINEKQTTEGLKVEALIAGSNSQITMNYHQDQYPTFSVRNVKSNGTIWTGIGDKTFEYLVPSETIDENNHFNGNTLSLALEFTYGDFDYFTGGDMTGLQGFGLAKWFDVETPVAKSVGQVDALALNHHGNRDATNENFLKGLAPQTIIQQTWVSDQPGGEVVHRIASKEIYPGERQIFSTSIVEETKVAIGPWMTKAFSSFEGHVVIRVEPGGATYKVYVLDDKSETLLVKAVYGPYLSNYTIVAVEK